MSEDHSLDGSSRTPSWWRALPTWIQVIVLVCWLPGVVAHELTHALAAQKWAQTSIDWDEIGCQYAWESSHPAPRVVAYIAPLLLGSALTVGLVAAVSGQPGITANAGVAAYLLVNLGVYTIASVADLVGAITALWATATGRRYETAQFDD